jgi:tRNA pseudouridine38-40 synthase
MHDTEPAPVAGGGLGAVPAVRVRLDLAYDGTDFSGFARQPVLRTVQGVLEQTLGTVLRLPAPPSLTCAGRTDAGVHARGQVAHVDLPAEVAAWLDLDALVRRLAGALPHDLRVQAASWAPPGFDARFSALRRHYRYRVCDTAAGPDPLRRHEVLWHARTLDVAAMDVAAAPLVGTHDFAAFCKAREGATTVRALEAFSWARTDDGLVEATVVADAFCHSMVRALVGASLAVGEGRRDAAWLHGVLTGGVRVPEVQVVAARGLTLERVDYPDDAAELAARADLTRNPRGPRWTRPNP